MSLSRVSDECAGMDAEFVFGHVKIDPNHDDCSGGHTQPGLIGGWLCSCACHSTDSRLSEPPLSTATSALWSSGDRAGGGGGPHFAALRRGDEVYE